MSTIFRNYGSDTTHYGFFRAYPVKSLQPILSRAFKHFSVLKMKKFSPCSDPIVNQHPSSGSGVESAYDVQSKNILHSLEGG